ncbi:hypothetical protein Acy02nite_15270 [Actinoplanes cyaneus]|uniref:Asparagine synthase n=1 Tax=Actinoplanes cyaneus TaxID=52696 RepID=A0A919IEB0_9ACTN|nr:hypothetical protein [Actinoplanes cyaneus]MCW2142196.1 asparagine synthase (glutamine-hydrolyzing) [Actinoplanes cyaneus]GID63646.1 hypothetical protein Acy02nite_15270 [Actinoplanes cyaneus]
MYVVLAWFTDRRLDDGATRAARSRFDAAVAEVVTDTYVRHDFGGEDWGVTFLHSADQGDYRWPLVATEGPVTALSLGLPVGVQTTGPVALARELLGGADIHRDVLPPFNLIALDGDRRFTIQQDWLGMCRLFTGTADGITAFCSRPSLLATFLYGSTEPDLEGWRSYAVSGFFGADLSPVKGVRLMQPGQRITGRRRDEGGWELTSETRYNVDDLVVSGFAGQGRPVEESLDLAADAFSGIATSIGKLYDGPIGLGLSGGKDSRLIASSLIAAGHMPKFHTNDDTVAEGETALRLMQILRDERGLQPEHRLAKTGAPANVLAAGLVERTEKLLRRYDFQFPSSYTIRPALDTRLPDEFAPVNFSGVGGELATGFWYPRVGGKTPEDEVLWRLTSAVPAGGVAPEVIDAERARVAVLFDHARGLGLNDLHLVDYGYLVERVRRWYSSAYFIGSITPYLSPGFVAASFGVTAEQKRDFLLHKSLIKRFVPEWADVPFVSAFTGTTTATRVWDGDGVQAISDLVDTAQGPIAQLINRDLVEKTLTTVVRTDNSPEHILRQFTYLAVASTLLEPGTVAAPTGATYARVTAPPPKPLPAAAQSPSRLRRFKKTWLWRAARKVLKPALQKMRS